jgi:hypothetical protein
VPLGWFDFICCWHSCWGVCPRLHQGGGAPPWNPHLRTRWFLKISVRRDTRTRGFCLNLLYVLSGGWVYFMVLGWFDFMYFWHSCWGGCPRLHQGGGAPPWNPHLRTRWFLKISVRRDTRTRWILLKSFICSFFGRDYSIVFRISFRFFIPRDILFLAFVGVMFRVSLISMFVIPI